MNIQSLILAVYLMPQLKHIKNFASDLFSEVLYQQLVFILCIGYPLDKWKVDRKVEFFFNYSGTLQMIKRAGQASWDKS